MKNHQEYTGPSVKSNGCNYASLYSYNQNYFGRGRVTVPQAAGSRSAEIVVVPSYGGMGYNSLNTNIGNQKIPSCSGFNNLTTAYPSFPSGCGAFSSRLCG